jgi:hypothetical protein
MQIQGRGRVSGTQLLLEQRQTEVRIRELRAALQHAGLILSQLGAALAASPESTVFGNAPPPLGDIPLRLLHSRGFDWNSIPDKVQLAQKIQELRDLQDHLEQIALRLSR